MERVDPSMGDRVEPTFDHVGFENRHHRFVIDSFMRWRKAAGEALASATTKRSKEWIEYDLDAFRSHYRKRPHLLLRRAWDILSEIGYLRIVNGILKRGTMEERAVRLRGGLTRLGPSFVKMGQALATRPDLLPPEYCAELTKLQDRLPAFPNQVAMDILKQELKRDPNEVFESFSNDPVGAASLGQVYKARLRGRGVPVAIKVQRPDLQEQVALDAVVLSMLARRYAGKYGIQSDAAKLVDEFVGRIFLEMDYGLEARNLQRFHELYDTRKGQGARASPGGEIHVPGVYFEHSTSKIITMEWMEGIKLTDTVGIKQLGLDTQKLVETGIFCGIKQLLEDGFFHADAHPGNLMASPRGALIYLDFGNVSEITKTDRDGLLKAFVAYVNNDAAGLVMALQSLDFLTPSNETGSWISALGSIFEGKKAPKKMDFAGAVQRIAEVAAKADVPFRVPPRLAPVIRSLAALEGTASSVQSGFQVVSRSYPYILKVLLKDRSPDMRKILRTIVLNSDGTVRWMRVQRLLQTVESNSSTAKGWDLKDNTEIYVQALEDAISFLLSEQGIRTRHHLQQDFLEAYGSGLRNFFKSSGPDFGRMIANKFGQMQDGGTVAWQLLTTSPNIVGTLPKQVLSRAEGRLLLLQCLLGLCKETSIHVLEQELLLLSKLMHRWEAVSL